MNFIFVLTFLMNLFNYRTSGIPGRLSRNVTCNVIKSAGLRLPSRCLRSLYSCPNIAGKTINSYCTLLSSRIRL